jgi:RNA polymerase sigma-70 factor (sigma-E family)
LGSLWRPRISTVGALAEKKRRALKRLAVGKRLSSVNETMAGEPAQAGTRPRPADHAAAVQDLFREHWLDLVRLATVMVGDVATAEDVVQDAFERLHRSWHRLREPASGLAYARSSVLNGCRSVHRRAAVARKYGPRLALPADAAGPDAATAAAQSSQVATALQGLTRRQREVIVLRYYADLDIAEIARTLRLSQGAVRATISRALTAMGRALEEDNDD